MTTTITIEIAQNDWNRIEKSFSLMLGLDHPATPAEVTDALEQYIGQTTQGYERQKHNQDFVPPPFETPGL